METLMKILGRRRTGEREGEKWESQSVTEGGKTRRQRGERGEEESNNAGLKGVFSEPLGKSQSCSPDKCPAQGSCQKNLKNPQSCSERTSLTVHMHVCERERRLGGWGAS